LSRTQTTDAATAAVVALHLRELPNVALEALMDLITIGGPHALVFAITEELASRCLQHLRR
jgi:hypothetical protein